MDQAEAIRERGESVEGEGVRGDSGEGRKAARWPQLRDPGLRVHPSGYFPRVHVLPW